MKEILGSDFYGITAASVDKYLTLYGWQRDFGFKNKNLMVFDNKALNKRIAIPSNESFCDFYIRLSEVLETIALLEKRDVGTVLKGMRSVCYDRLEFRIISEFTKNGSLPLDYAANCIEGIKDLILYSACAAQNAQPICARATSAAKGIMQSFRFGQTELGSFVINVDSKVADDDYVQQSFLDNNPTIPLGHKVVERICTAVNQVDKAVKENQRIGDVVETAYKDGITANMCDALMKLKPTTNTDIEIDTTIRYAPALVRDEKPKSCITIGAYHFFVIDEMAKYYRDKVLYQEVELKGMFKGLSSQEQSDSLEKKAKMITSFDGKYRIVTLAFSNEEQNRIACDAYKEEREVRVKGILDMSERSWIVNDISLIEVI